MAKNPPKTTQANAGVASSNSVRGDAVKDEAAPAAPKVEETAPPLPPPPAPKAKPVGATPPPTAKPETPREVHRVPGPQRKFLK